MFNRCKRPNENKISHRRSAARPVPAGLRVWSTGRDVRSLLAASHYRLTRVVHELRCVAPPTLRHRRHPQIVNNSAASKTLSVDKSASLICVQAENTHRPATNMHHKRFQDHFNQSFGRARCASVRQTNSHLPTRFQRLDYKAFAEREQCVFDRRATQNQQKEQLP